MNDRPKILVLLADYSWAPKNVVAATLAWMTTQTGWFSEVYYDSYRLGDHFGGGPLGKTHKGKPHGSLFWSGRHLERLLLLNAMAELQYIIVGSVSLTEQIPKDPGKVVVRETEPANIYKAVMEKLGIHSSRPAVWIGSRRGKLTEIDAYCYPEIYRDRALGFSGSLDRRAAEALKSLGIEQITGLFCTREEEEAAQRTGLQWETRDALKPEDGYGSVTQRLSRRAWKRGDGFFVGDPVVVSYWIPWNCRHGRLPLYGVPQAEPLAEMAEWIRQGPTLVFGRQYDDRDFKILSEQGCSIQLVDPLRPAFPVISDIRQDTLTESGPVAPSDLSDGDLEEFAREGKILASLLFWSGAVRELENLEPLFELAATLKLRMGVILTSESFRFGWPTPLKSMVWPIDRGGAFPYVEPLMGSFGEGIGLEGYGQTERFRESLIRAVDMVRGITGGNLVPTGWWPTLDGELIPSRESDGNIRNRPFGQYRSDHPRKEMWEAVRSAGIEYAFSTFGLGRPAVLYREKEFIVLNQTAGIWEGWSPFVDIASFGDLLTAEKSLVASGGPGWMVGTLDSCLWTFANPRWRRGPELRNMAQLLLDGGRSGRLFNVTPKTIARYARILLDQGYLQEGGPVGARRVTPAGYVRWMDSRIRKNFKKKG